MHPHSLILLFAIRPKTHWILDCRDIQRQLKLDYADAQAALGLCWMHMSKCIFSHVWFTYYRTEQNFIYLTTSQATRRRRKKRRQKKKKKKKKKYILNKASDKVNTNKHCTHYIPYIHTYSHASHVHVCRYIYTCIHNT